MPEIFAAAVMLLVVLLGHPLKLIVYLLILWRRIKPDTIGMEVIPQWDNKTSSLCFILVSLAALKYMMPLHIGTASKITVVHIIRE